MHGVVGIMASGLAAAIQAPGIPSKLVPQSCGADRITGMVGRKWEKRNRTMVLKQSGAKRLRIYVPGTPLTLEYSPDRLNIETTPRGRITRVSCG